MMRYKKAVERAVRPVIARAARKDRMRAELYAHLWDIHDAEAERGGTEEEMIERTLARFGDPRPLREALQHSVPWAERILFVPIPGLSFVRRASLRRMAVTRRVEEFPVAVRSALALLAVMTFVALVLNPILTRTIKTTPDYERVFVLGSTIGVLSVLNLFCVALLNIAGYAAMRRRHPSRADRARVWAYGALTGGVVFASGMTFSLLGSGYFRFSLSDVAPLAAMAVAVPVLTALCSLSTAIECRRYLEWGSLRIEAS